MIDRLRRRFIAVAMLAVIVVLVAITAFINLWNLQNIRQNADQTLTLILENGGHFPRDLKDKQPNDRLLDRPVDRPDGHKGGALDLSPEAPFSTRYFSVTLGAAGEELSVNTGSIAAVDTAGAVELASQIFARGKQSGFQGIYRYLVQQQEDGHTLVSFLDCRKELYTLRAFFINSLWVDLVGFAAVSGLILLFSRAAVRPVVRSYEKQKQFITDAGHELKTPLAVIGANVEVLELETGESQWTASIRGQVERMSQLTGQLTALAAMEEAQTQLTLEELDLSEAVEKTARAMQPLAAAGGHSLALAIDPGIYTIGNHQLLCQLMGILLDNAVKYAVSGSAIRLALTRQGKGARLIVQNCADGLSIGRQEQLFERFYRADASRSRETGGHGLGLSIAQAIVTAHKGKICAHSPDGENLIITVYLK